MKTKVEALPDNQVKLTITVDAKEIDDRIKKTYKDFAYKYNFPGFRRGKAPRPIIDNALGKEAVPATVTDDIFKECYPLAVDESGIYPVAQPAFEDQETLIEAGKDFTFSAKITVKPELELSSYEPVEIELPKDVATDDEIAEQIDAMREHYFTFEDAASSAKIEEGGIAEIAMKATDDKGEAIEALDTDSRQYALGSGFYPVEFDNELIGLKKGQKKSFDLEFKGLFTAGLAAIAGQTDKVHFDIEVKSVKKKVLPEANDEWAKETMGFEGLDDLKTRLADSITQSKQEQLPRLKENRCLAVLAERLVGEVPESMVSSNEAELLQNFFQQLQSQGATLDAYLQQVGVTMEEFKEDVKKQALDVSKQDLALDAWAKHAQYKVSSKDMTEEFVNSGVEDPKALEAEWRTNGQLHTLRQGILRVRAIKDVMDNAKVTEVDDGKKKSPAKKAPAKKKSTKKDESATDESKKKASGKKSEAVSDKADGVKSTAKKQSAKKTTAKDA